MDVPTYTNIRNALPTLSRFVAYDISLTQDTKDTNPLVRGLALRTLSSIQTRNTFQALLGPLQRAFFYKDPYVRKICKISVAKLHAFDPLLAEKNGFVENLHGMILDDNPTVVTGAAAALFDIAERSTTMELRINYSVASKLVEDTLRCSVWGQTYILEILMFYVPRTSQEAEYLAERACLLLRQSNPSVVLTAVKLVLYLMNYIAGAEHHEVLCRRMSPMLVHLLNSPSEIQYSALRMILLIVQRRPLVLRDNVSSLFCKFNDPFYIKNTKLDLICRLTHEDNANEVLAELKECVVPGRC